MDNEEIGTQRTCFSCRRRGIALEPFVRDIQMWPCAPLRRYCVWVCHHCSQLPTIEQIVVVKLARINKLEKTAQ